MNRIIGKSINLELIVEDDLELIRSWRNSEEVSKYMLSNSFISKFDQQQWFKMICEKKYYLYWMICLKNGEKLGVAYFNTIDEEKKIFEPSLYLGQLSSRNSFYGIEAYYQILNFAFEKFKLPFIYGKVLSTNYPAIKMNNLFGFKIEKTSAESSILNVKLASKDFYNCGLVTHFKRKS
jgi:UDP-4-amino-4,6-dideoxy-N-acetyl-beta-L-altrosamine N-acetyltransferase